MPTTEDKRITYNIMANLDPCQLVPAMGEVVTSLNKTMHDFGFLEKLRLQSNVKLASISSLRELTSPELQKIAELTEQEFQAKLPNWKVKITEIKMANTHE